MNPLRLIGAFRKDRRGNIAVTFAIACVPLIAAIGCAVDYTIAATIRTKLLAAADAASVGSVSKNSPAFVAAAAMSTDGSIAVGVTDAKNIFNVNVSNVKGFTLNPSTPVVTKTGTTITSTVPFSAKVPTSFLSVINLKTITVAGTSTSKASLPPYIDYYLMLDVSGSMGLPSTDAEQSRLAAINPDNYTQYTSGCLFACHFSVQNVCTDSTEGYPTNNFCLGYAISRVSQAGYKQLLQTDNSNPMKKRLPSWMISGLPNSLYNSLQTQISVPAARISTPRSRG
jgi:Flp pilus assembly protein TadG